MSLQHPQTPPLPKGIIQVLVHQDQRPSSHDLVARLPLALSHHPLNRSSSSRRHSPSTCYLTSHDPFEMALASPPCSSLLHLCRPAQLKGSNSKPNLAVVVHEDCDIQPRQPVDSVCCKSARCQIVLGSNSLASPTSVTFCPAPVPPSMKVDTQAFVLKRPYPLRRATSDTGCTSSTSTSIASTSLEHVACHAGLRSADPTALVAKPRSEWQVSKGGR